MLVKQNTPTRGVLPGIRWAGCFQLPAFKGDYDPGIYRFIYHDLPGCFLCCTTTDSRA